MNYLVSLHALISRKKNINSLKISLENFGVSCFFISLFLYKLKMHLLMESSVVFFSLLNLLEIAILFKSFWMK